MRYTGGHQVSPLKDVIKLYSGSEVPELKKPSTGRVSEAFSLFGLWDL